MKKKTKDAVDDTANLNKSKSPYIILNPSSTIEDGDDDGGSMTPAAQTLRPKKKYKVKSEIAEGAVLNFVKSYLKKRKEKKADKKLQRAEQNRIRGHLDSISRIKGPVKRKKALENFHSSEKTRQNKIEFHKTQFKKYENNSPKAAEYHRKKLISYNQSVKSSKPVNRTNIKKTAPPPHPGLYRWEEKQQMKPCIESLEKTIRTHLENRFKPTEEINELSKGTLKSYVKKSLSSLSVASGSHGYLTGQGDPDDTMAGKTAKEHKKDITKRYVGINKAVNRLADAKYGQAKKSLAKSYKRSMGESFALIRKSNQTGIPVSILKEVFNRGIEAYHELDESDLTASQYAFGRVNSFISGGEARELDKDLLDENNFPKIKTSYMTDKIKPYRDELGNKRVSKTTGKTKSKELKIYRDEYGNKKVNGQKAQKIEESEVNKIYAARYKNKIAAIKKYGDLDDNHTKNRLRLYQKYLKKYTSGDSK